jgi:hypothetical protein
VQTKNTAANTPVVRDRKLAPPAGTEQTARAAAAKRSTHIGTFAVLNEDQPNHAQSGQDLDRQQSSSLASSFLKYS